MTPEQYIQCIKVRALCIVMQDELDTLAKGNPTYKHSLKRHCKAFRVELDKEMENLYKILPPDVIEEYNRLGNALQEGVNEIIKVAIVD
jgi:hypothetical protein